MRQNAVKVLRRPAERRKMLNVRLALAMMTTGACTIKAYLDGDKEADYIIAFVDCLIRFDGHCCSIW
jgi:hypothetical protein